VGQTLAAINRSLEIIAGAQDNAASCREEIKYNLEQQMEPERNVKLRKTFDECPLCDEKRPCSCDKLKDNKRSCFVITLADLLEILHKKLPLSYVHEIMSDVNRRTKKLND